MDFQDFQGFSEIFVKSSFLLEKYIVHTPIFTCRRLRRELEVPEVLGSRFRMRRHALDVLKTFWNRFDNLYFSSKNNDFRKFLKILGNPGNP